VEGKRLTNGVDMAILNVAGSYIAAASHLLSLIHSYTACPIAA
jgi:hypothetical protein